MNLKQALFHFTQETGLRIYIMAFLNLVTSTLEGVSLLLFLPLLNLSFDERESQQGLSIIIDLLDKVFEKFSAYTEYEKQITLLILISFILILKAIIYFMALSVSSAIKHQLVEQSRRKLFKKYLNAKLIDFQVQGKGYYVSMLTEQVNRYMNAFQYFANTLSASISASVYLFLAILTNVHFGTSALITGIVILLFLRRLTRITSLKSTELTYKTSDFNNSILYLLEGFQYLKITKTQKPLLKEFLYKNQNLKNISVSLSLLSNFIKSMKEPFVALPLVMLMIISLYANQSSLISMMVVMLMFYRAMNYIMALQMNLQLYSEHYGSLNLIIKELSTSEAQLFETQKTSAQNIFSIHLENVSFCYSGSDTPIISDLSANIECGDRVAIIGQSGAGKSTLINLICKQLAPDEGQISYRSPAGNAINDDLKEISFGFLGQEPRIFEGDLAFNVTLKHDPTKNELTRAKKILEDLGLEDFALQIGSVAYPNRKNSISEMSLGQKQRLHLARELFRQVDILVLDEPTSALDSDNENRIVDILSKLDKSITLIFVTHRPKLLKICNKKIDLNV